jgi:hypothetical protein
MAGMASIAISRRTLPEAALTDAGCNRLFTCEELVGAAAKELAAFLTVVNLDFGSEQAHQAAEEWLQELGRYDCFAQEAIPDFRQLTIATADRLARRIGKSAPIAQKALTDKRRTPSITLRWRFCDKSPNQGR